MGERKVLNKYFPPDFDPTLIPRRQRGKNPKIEVRMMLPMSIQCDTCGEYMYRGKKFNSKKEDVLDDDYHGIKIFRFYIKCITCAATITFKTDPKSGDYVSEKGCSRNFEPWRENEAENEAAVKERVEEEAGDSMKTLENRTVDSKREMDILDALDEIKAINQRHERVDTNMILEMHSSTDVNTKVTLDDDQEQAAKVMFAAAKKRKADEDANSSVKTKNAKNITATFPVLKKKKIVAPITITKKSSILVVQPKKKETKKPTLMGLVAYGSSDSSSD